MNPLKLCVLVSMCTAAQLRGDDPAELRHRLLTDGVQAERAYRQRLASGCRFRCRFEVFHGSGESRVRQGIEESQAFFSFPNRILEISTFKEGILAGVVVVDGINENYRFQLARRSAAIPWSVSKLSSSGLSIWLQSGTSVKLGTLTDEQLLVHDQLPVLDVYYWPVEQLLGSPLMTNFSVKRDEKKRVAVTFAGTIPTLEGEESIRGGTIWLSPERAWAVDEYRIQVTYKKGKRDGTTYEKHGAVQWVEADGCPVPAMVSTKNFFGGKLAIERRWTFSDWHIQAFPRERFRLSHYGLPEPGLPEKVAAGGTRRWYVLLWANGAGVILIVVALLIRFRFRGHSSDA